MYVRFIALALLSLIWVFDREWAEERMMEIRNV